MQFHFSKVFQQFVSAFSMRILRPQQGKGGKITKSQIIPSFFLLELVQGQQKHLRPPPCTLLSPCSHQSQEEGKIKVSRRRSIVVLLLASHPSQRLLYELSSRSETPVALPFPIPKLTSCSDLNSYHANYSCFQQSELESGHVFDRTWHRGLEVSLRPDSKQVASRRKRASIFLLALALAVKHVKQSEVTTLDFRWRGGGCRSGSFGRREISHDGARRDDILLVLLLHKHWVYAARREWSQRHFPDLSSEALTHVPCAALLRLLLLLLLLFRRRRRRRRRLRSRTRGGISWRLPLPARAPFFTLFFSLSLFSLSLSLSFTLEQKKTFCFCGRLNAFSTLAKFSVSFVAEYKLHATALVQKRAYHQWDEWKTFNPDLKTFNGLDGDFGVTAVCGWCSVMESNWKKNWLTTDERILRLSKTLSVPNSNNSWC